MLKYNLIVYIWDDGLGIFVSKIIIIIQFREEYIWHESQAYITNYKGKDFSIINFHHNFKPTLVNGKELIRETYPQFLIYSTILGYSMSN